MPGRGDGMLIGELPAATVDVKRELGPYDAGAMYGNFADRPEEGTRFHSEHAHERLRAVKAAYDPHDVFRANHPIAPAAREEQRTRVRAWARRLGEAMG